MSCFLHVLQRMNSVNYNFIMLRNEMESCKNRGEGFKKSYVPLHEGRGGQSYQNHSYVINEWSLNCIV